MFSTSCICVDMSFKVRSLEGRRYINFDCDSTFFRFTPLRVSLRGKLYTTNACDNAIRTSLILKTERLTIILYQHSTHSYIHITYLHVFIYVNIKRRGNSGKKCIIYAALVIFTVTPMMGHDEIVIPLNS